MPSGSHGISGGSHFSGGGSSFSGGGRSGGNSNPSGPINLWFFGGRYYIPSEKAGFIRFLFSLCFLCAFFMFTAGVVIGGTNEDINKIKTDRNYYIAMIERAEEDPSLQVTGNVIDIFYNSDCHKWYIQYEVRDEGTNEILLTGFTYCLYNDAEIRYYTVGNPIELALNSSNITERTDSVNMDYKDMPLERDGEYIVAKRTKDILIWVEVGLGIAFVASIVVTVIQIKKNIKMKEEEKKKLEEKEKAEQLAKQPKRCSYCGTILKEGDRGCPNCGAKQ